MGLNITGPKQVRLQAEQARVVNAVSPTAQVAANEDGALITVHDLNGTTTAQINHGATGQTGQTGQTGPAGADGYSPTASVSKSGSTATITITDKNGTTTAQVNDGQNGTNGQDGQPGADGYSPTASVTKSGSTATITITDKNGATTATVSDGQNGTNGQDGAPGVGVPSGGTQGQVLAKSSGTDYATAWVTPYTGLQIVNVSGSTPSITGVADTRYICGEVSTLDITLPASGIIDVVFESGSTPTVLTVTPPAGMTMKWANGFAPTQLDANTTYEINIADGLGVAGRWT